MKKFLLDTCERAISTYIEAFIGLLLVAEAINIEAMEVALVAALPAALAVVKAAIASRIGKKGTAALLPE